MIIKTNEIDVVGTLKNDNITIRAGGPETNNVAVTINGSKRIWEFSVPSDSYAGFDITWAARMTDGTDQEVKAGTTQISFVDKAGTMTHNYVENADTAYTISGSAGQVTVDIEHDEANNKAYIIVTHAQQDMTPTSGEISLKITTNYFGTTLTLV